MKNLAKNFPTLLVLVCLALLAFSLVQAGRSTDSQETNGVQDRPNLVEAVRRGGLREGARIKGRYVASIRTSGWLKYDIETLVKNSEAVVTATPGNGVSRLTSDSRQIFTDYEVKLDEVIKADSASETQ